MKDKSIISIRNGSIVDFQGNKRHFRGMTVSLAEGSLPPPSLQEADAFFDQLRKNDTTILRWQILWEDIEGTGPDNYNEAFLADLRSLLKKAEAAGILVFLEPLMAHWGSCLGGLGAPAWTVEVAGLEGDMDGIQKRDAMFSLFWAGKKIAPDLMVEGDNIQDYLQGHYIAAMRHTARRVKDCKTVVGFGIMAEGQPGNLQALELFPLDFAQDCLKPFQKKFMGAFQKKHSHYLFLAQAMTTGHFSQWKFHPGYNTKEATTTQREGGVIPDADSEASKVITLLSFSPPQKNILSLFSKDRFRSKFLETIKKASGGGNAVMVAITSTQGMEYLQELVQEEGLSYFLNKRLS